MSQFHNINHLHWQAEMNWTTKVIALSAIAVAGIISLAVLVPRQLTKNTIGTGNNNNNNNPYAPTDYVPTVHWTSAPSFSTSATHDDAVLQSKETKTPTRMPFALPTVLPTNVASDVPSLAVSTTLPTSFALLSSKVPTVLSSSVPSHVRSNIGSLSLSPTNIRSYVPSDAPSTGNSLAPITQMTNKPSKSIPIQTVTLIPVLTAPSNPSGVPSKLPLSSLPPDFPTNVPTLVLVAIPTSIPTNIPVSSALNSKAPAVIFSQATVLPTDVPSIVPSDLPSITFSKVPSTGLLEMATLFSNYPSSIPSLQLFNSASSTSYEVSDTPSLISTTNARGSVTPSLVAQSLASLEQAAAGRTFKGAAPFKRVHLRERKK
jgi:hypothetical protein